HERAENHFAEMDRRRSVRMFSDEAVPRELIDLAIMSASTAPSGAHKQPWMFAVTDAPEVKRQIREAAEQEERVNYEGGRMNNEWQTALAPLGTDYHKEFLEVAPWIVVLFEVRFRLTDAGQKLHNYYVKESVGMAAGLFISALHNMGLVTLTHTPSPMGFLRSIMGRPDHERPFALFPVGFPMEDTKVPVLARRTLDEVSTTVTEPMA
ncbi:MAG: nitroreductase family protein, partial [Acidimicrobiales bacterium]